MFVQFITFHFNQNGEIKSFDILSAIKYLYSMGMYYDKPLIKQKLKRGGMAE